MLSLRMKKARGLAEESRPRRSMALGEAIDRELGLQLGLELGFWRSQDVRYHARIQTVGP